MIDDKFLKNNNARKLIDFHKYESSLDVLETGIFALDMALGEKGNDGRRGARARSIIELIGDSNAGKSSASIQFIKTTIDRYGPGSVVALYAEPPDLHIYQDKGIDLDDVYMLSCYDGEIDSSISAKETVADTQLNNILNFAEQEEIRLVVVDSIAALVSYSQLYESSGKAREVGEANPLAALEKVVSGFVTRFQRRNKHAVLLMTNHYKIAIKAGMFAEVLPPDQIQSPGGRCKEYLSKYRIMLRGFKEYASEKHSVDDVKKPDAIRDTFKVFKRKVGAPRTVTSTLNLHDGTYNNEEKILDYACFFGSKEKDTIKSKLAIPVARAGAWYFIGSEKLNGAEKAVEYLKANPDITQQLKMEVFKYSDEFFEDDLDLVE